MIGNRVIHMTTGKLLGATVLPNSVLLITGIIIWQFWRKKQTHLQAETDKLYDEIEHIKEQMADIQTAQHENQSLTLPPSPHEHTASTRTGLFELLIEDNIQLRKHMKE